MMMMTQFNLQPQTKNTTSNRPAESQPLHVEIQGVYAKEIAPHIAPLQKKMKWVSIVLISISILTVTIFLFSILHNFSGLFSFLNVSQAISTSGNAGEKVAFQIPTIFYYGAVISFVTVVFF
jgi:hypothetical protein